MASSAESNNRAHSDSVGIGVPGLGGGATADITMLKFCVASGAVPLVAVTVPLKVPIGPECDKKCSGLRDVELGRNAGRGYSSNFGLPADDVPKVAIGPGGDTPSA